MLGVANYRGGPAAQGGKDPDNMPKQRSGSAVWVAMTDKDGKGLTMANPFDNETRGGRAAADELNGTPYRRPEDMEVGYLRNGHEALYFTATEELAVYSVEELGHGKAMVRLAVDEGTIKNAGFASTTAHLTSPDNLAQDALGNIYVIEDWPNGDNRGGDIWFLRDTDRDGVAESLDQFISLQVKGAENTGMIFNPANPTQFIINIQHPASTSMDGGQGDATWLIDIKDVVAPPCVNGEDGEDGEDHEYKRDHSSVKTCNKKSSSKFIKKLIKAAR